MRRFLASSAVTIALCAGAAFAPGQPATRRDHELVSLGCKHFPSPDGRFDAILTHTREVWISDDPAEKPRILGPEQDHVWVRKSSAGPEAPPVWDREIGVADNSGVKDVRWTPDGRFLLLVHKAGFLQGSSWDMLHMVDTRSGTERTRYYLVSRPEVSGEDSIRYIALVEQAYLDPQVTRKASFLIADLFDRPATYLHFVTTRKEPDEDDKDGTTVCALYAVKGNRKARVPAYTYWTRGGSSFTSDEQGYAQEPYLSPDGRWLFVVIKVCSGANEGFLYRRVGRTLRFNLVSQDETFLDSLWDYYARTHHLSRRMQRRLATWQMVLFGGWDLQSRRLYVGLNTGDP